MAEVSLNIGTVLLMFILGAVCSAAMVIPGVSGSMILKTLGYYEPVVTGAIPALVKGLTGGDWAAVLNSAGLLVPFALGIVAGIFGIAKLIEVLMKKWKGRTYCAILGMVLASPVVILMDGSIYRGVNWILVAVSAAAAVIGAFIAVRLGGEPEKA